MIRVANLSKDARYFKWEFFASPFHFDSWVKEEEWVHDADVCGDTKSFWVVMYPDRTTYFIVCHSWWIDYEPEWDLHNVFDITEITRDGVTEKYAKANLKFVV